MSAITAETRNAYRRLASLLGLAGLGLITVIVALGGVIASTPAGVERAAPPGLAPTASFPFGTDSLGRDVLSETVHGLTVTFSTALLAMVIVVAVGAVAGFAAARVPLRLGLLVRAFTGVLGAVPVVVLAIVIARILGDDFVALAAGLAAVPAAFNRSFDRAARLAQSRHAIYARATGIPASTLLRRDLVYEVRAHFTNVTARALASVTIALATMSFLGFAAAAPHRDLGLMIADARPDYFNLWWTALFPALALGLLILFARLAAGLGEGEPP